MNKKIQSQVLKEIKENCKKSGIPLEYSEEVLVKKAISRTIELMEEEVEKWKKQSSDNQFLGFKQGGANQKADFRKMIEEEKQKEIKCMENDVYDEQLLEHQNQIEMCDKLLAKLGTNHSPQESIEAPTSKGGSLEGNTCICGHDENTHNHYGKGGCQRNKCFNKCKKFQEKK